MRRPTAFWLVMAGVCLAAVLAIVLRRESSLSHDDLLTLAAVRIGQINGEVAVLEERMGDQEELIDAQKKALDVQELKIESLTSRIDDLEQKVR